MPPASPHFQRSPREIQNLHDIIDSATTYRLRLLLKKLSTRAHANYTFLQDELMLPHGALKRAWSANDEDDGSLDECSEDSGYDLESDDSDDHEDAPASRQRFEICRQCNEEYDVLYNNKESCAWHEGKL